MDGAQDAGAEEEDPEDFEEEDEPDEDSSEDSDEWFEERNRHPVLHLIKNDNINANSWIHSVPVYL